MYEAFFALRTRPFSAVADQETFVPTPAVEDGLRKTLDCIQAGNGPAVVTGESGTGKTAFCREVLRRTGDRSPGAYLGSTVLRNSLELWQAILFELGREFAGLTEHEARLGVIDAARSRSPGREGVLLVVDDAHRLEPRLLDELWQLTTHLVDGRPAIRLVLGGLLELEERLASPELDALNRHLGAHVVLEPLTAGESLRFIADQLELAGARPDDMFTHDALELICRAGDGNCRALNQLCDHSLLLAFVAEEKPVTAATVQAALDDLKGLPQHWNDVAQAPGEADAPFDADSAFPSANDDVAAEPGPATAEDEESGWPADDSGQRAGDDLFADVWDDAEISVIEVGGEAAASPSLAPVFQSFAPTPAAPGQPLPAATAEETREFGVDDPYARLDRLAELGVANVPQPYLPLAGTADAPVAAERQVLAQVEELRDEVRSSRSRLPVGDERRPATESPPVNDLVIPDEDDLLWDVIEPEPDEPEPDEPEPYEPALVDVQTTAREIAPALPDDRATPLPPPASSLADHTQADRSTSSQTRRYAQLFTRLKRRRRNVAEALRGTLPFREG